jgi:hypothetical protein
MDADEQRIRELERGFRRDGLPNLIVDLSATEDVFTRSPSAPVGRICSSRSPARCCCWRGSAC